MGSGQNGLIIVVYLAKAGKKVLVLEKQSYPSGGIASLTMAELEFTSEQHSAMHQMILANPLVIKDELQLQSKFPLFDLSQKYRWHIPNPWAPVSWPT
jgi:phytoene dehydrogenase-like protein